MFTFCPLQGALSESTASQSLLELDGGVKVLIDVGWDESFEVEKLRELEKQIPTLSLILLTHATLSHIGAYAHCCKHLPLFSRIPVYATRPVIDLGRNLTQDLYASTPAAATTIPATSLAEVSYAYSQTAATDRSDFLLQAPTSEEIARYFSLIQPLKYSQPHQPLPSPFSPPLNGLTITAYNSGRTLGGTIWHIQHGLESIVYAVDWTQARENVFSGAAWLGGGSGQGGSGTEVMEQLRKPTALICSSRTPEAALARARRDEQLLESLKLCIARGGTVLIPADSSARVLELAYLLEHTWRDEVAADNPIFRRSKLFLAGRNISSTMRNVRSMLEWMDDRIVREFEAVADGVRRVVNGGGADRGGGGGGGGGGAKAKEAGPFDFKHLRLLERKAQIEYILRQGVEDAQPQGRVILASDSSLDWGFSKDVLRSIASDARNLVILTEKPSLSASDRPSPARTLWGWWKERKDGVATEQTSSGDVFEQVYSGGRELELWTARRRALEGGELDVYQQWLATQRQLQATLQTAGPTALESAVDAVDDVSSDSSTDSEESDTEQQGKALNVSTTMGQASRKKVVLKDEDLGIAILLKKKGVYDFDVRGKKGRERMFPIAVRRRRHDDFGELIRPEEYLRAEEREDADGAETATAQRPGQADREADGLGKKRKWDDVGAAAGGASGGKGQSGGPNKRPQLNHNVSADEADMAAAAALADGPGGDVLDGLEDDEQEAIEKDIPAAGPCKLVVTHETVRVNLRIAVVDFSGLHDRRSLNMLIPLIQPRKLVLVAGNADETLALAADCRKLLGAQHGAGATDHDNSKEEKREDEERESEGGKHAVEVLTPGVGVVVDASVDTNAWVIRLADPLVKRLKWQNVRGLGIVTVTGVLVRPGGKQLSISATANGDGHVKKGHDGVKDGESGSEEDGAQKKRLKLEDGAAADGSSDSKDGNEDAKAVASASPTLNGYSAPTGTTTAIATTTATTAADADEALPILDVLPTSMVSAVRSAAPPLHVGDLRLADLRRAMLAGGHTAEFRGEGTLLIDGVVTVRKSAAGRIEIDSIALPAADPSVIGGGTFYAVRRKIYEGLAVVAGGVSSW